MAKRSKLSRAIPAGHWSFVDWRSLSDALIDGDVGVTRITRAVNGAITVKLGLNEGIATCTQDDFALSKCVSKGGNRYELIVSGKIKIAVPQKTYSFSVQYTPATQRLAVDRLGGTQKVASRSDLPAAVMQMNFRTVSLDSCCVQKLNSIGRVGRVGHEFIMIDAVSDALGWLDVTANGVVSKLPEAIYYGVSKAAKIPGAKDLGAMCTGAKRRAMQTTIAPCYTSHTGAKGKFWDAFAKAWGLELTH